ncbi:MAG TPA: hypothetical protein VNI83_02170 [Vicinamibacterales bacterium]|nr:hypothetical protein [Vicinamibacterales bacterium]
MPYVVVKAGNKWIVRKKGGSRRLGQHISREKALRQLRALYASTKE